MVLYLLAILAVGAALVLQIANAQSGRAWALAVSAAGVLVAFMVMSGAGPRRTLQGPPAPPAPPPPPPAADHSSPFVINQGSRRRLLPRPDEAEVQRIFNVTAYAATILIASLSVSLALASPTLALVVISAAAVWVVFWWPVAARTFHLSSTVVIARDPASVFAFVSDFRNTPKYYFMYEQTVEKVTPGPIGRGTQFRAHVNFHEDQLPGGGQASSYDGVDEIVDFEPNRRLTSRVSSGRRRNLDTITFEEVGSATRVTHRFDYVHSYGGALYGMRLRNRATDRYMKANRDAAWARAKQILESHSETTA
jgi:hypothetical protein